MAPGDLRFVFAGTPDFAARHLVGLLDAGYSPVAVYTQPDRPSGRGKKLTPGPVKRCAISAGLPVLQPPTLKTPVAQAALSDFAPDLMIVVAYGLILPQPVLDIPRHGCLNVHASLLPRWRGAAPIQRAIEAGDSETGITIMRMEAGLDTGPIVRAQPIAIEPHMTAGSLQDALADIGLPLLVETLETLESALSGACAQDDAIATYARKIDKAEARIDWTRPAASLERQIRAFNPLPVCWTTLDDLRIKVWQSALLRDDEGPGSRAPGVGMPGSRTPGTLLAVGDSGLLVATADDPLKLTHLQLPGGKPLPAAEMLRARGHLFTAGKRFR